MSAGFPGAMLAQPVEYGDQSFKPGDMTPGDALGGGLTLTDPVTGLPRGQTQQAPGAYAGRNFGPGDFSTPFLGRPAPGNYPGRNFGPGDLSTPFLGLPAPEQMPGQTDPGVFLGQPVDTPRVFDQPQQMPQSQAQPGMPPAPAFPQFGTVIPQQTLPVVQQILNRPRLFGPAPGQSITQQQPQIPLPQVSQPQSQPYQLPVVPRMQPRPMPQPRITQPLPIMRPGSGLRGIRRR